jgi:hypothetical protein
MGCKSHGSRISVLQGIKGLLHEVQYKDQSEGDFRRSRQLQLPHIRNQHEPDGQIGQNPDYGASDSKS